MIDILKALCEIQSPSGAEHALRDKVISLIDGFCDWHTDAMGNILAVKKGVKEAGKRILFSAHMDEVGLIVTSILEDGFLSFAPVGGISPEVLAGRAVIIGDIPGVVGIKPFHLQDADERKQPLKIDDLYIDIGAVSKADAEKYISPGAMGTFATDFIELSKSKLAARGLDDKAGVAVLIDVIRNVDLPCDVYFAFTVQEEIGCRGAKTAAFALKPDVAVTVETTTAADLPDTPEHERVCELSRGAALSFMDHSALYDRPLLERIKGIAEKNNIPWQLKSVVAGGNDSSAFQQTGQGSRVAAVNVPCRYLHSGSCVIDTTDLLAVRKLCEAIISEVPLV